MDDDGFDWLVFVFLGWLNTALMVAVTIGAMTVYQRELTVMFYPSVVVVCGFLSAFYQVYSGLAADLWKWYNGHENGGDYKYA